MTTCITNRCSQGHAPCPTPGACNGGTQPALPTQHARAEEHRATAEAAIVWVVGVVCLFLLVLLLSLAAGYFTART